MNLTDEQIDAALRELAQHTRLPYGGPDAPHGRVVVRRPSNEAAAGLNRSAMRRVIAAALGDSTEPPPRDRHDGVCQPHPIVRLGRR